jgi:ribosomal protein L37AE/L43A
MKKDLSKKKNNLLSCPFCGSKPHHESTITEEVIRCSTCPASMFYDGSFEALRSMWNYRKKGEQDGKAEDVHKDV